MRALPLRGADQPGQRHFGRVVHEQVDVVVFAVELDQFGLEVRAHGAHGFFASCEDSVGERAAPVFGCEDQVGVEGVDDGFTPANVGFWFPAG